MEVEIKIEMGKYFAEYDGNRTKIPESIVKQGEEMILQYATMYFFRAVKNKMHTIMDLLAQAHEDYKDLKKQVSLLTKQTGGNL